VVSEFSEGSAHQVHRDPLAAVLGESEDVAGDQLDVLDLAHGLTLGRTAPRRVSSRPITVRMAEGSTLHIRR
jgi:hypothetical protein